MSWVSNSGILANVMGCFIYSRLVRVKSECHELTAFGTAAEGGDCVYRRVEASDHDPSTARAVGIELPSVRGFGRFAMGRKATFCPSCSFQVQDALHVERRGDVSVPLDTPRTLALI